MNFDKIDKILLTGDDATKILEWDRINHHKFDSLEFPISEALIITTTELNYLKGKPSIKEGLYFKISENSVYIAIYDMMDMKKLTSINIGEGFDPLNMDVEIFYDKVTRDMAQKDMQIKVLLLFSLFQYMNHHREVIQSKNEVRQVAKKSKHGKSSSKNRITRIKTVTYTFDHSKIDTEKRKYERHIESWTQRGFWRHYKKSGKTVWIDPQVKGAGEIKPKTYKL